MDTFYPIFSSFRFEKIIIGPALISSVENQEIAAVILALERNSSNVSKDKSKDSKNLKIFLLTQTDSLVEHKKISNPLDLVDNNMTLQSSRTIERLINSGSYLLLHVANELEKLCPKECPSALQEIIKKPSSEIVVEIDYDDSLHLFKESPKTNKTLDLSANSTFMEYLTKLDILTIYYNSSEYFEGHLFNAMIECGSQVECRDGIIEAKTMIKSSEIISKLPESYRVKASVRIVEFDEEDTAKPNTFIKRSALGVFGNSYYSVLTKDRIFSNSSWDSLIENCSEISTFKNIGVMMCSQLEKRKQYIRIFILPSMVWFDIEFASKSFFFAKNMKSMIVGNLIYFLQYNEKFRTFNNLFAFKIVMDQDFNYSFEASEEMKGTIKNHILLSGTGTKYWKDGLENQLYFIFLFETKLNSISIDFFSHITESNINHEEYEDIYIVGSRKDHYNEETLVYSKYRITYEKIKQISTLKEIKMICDHRYLLIKFNLQDKDSFLISKSKIKILPQIQSIGQYLDIMLHLPQSNDLLIRTPIAEIQTSNLQTRFFDGRKIAIVPLSNPFFGMAMDAGLPSIVPIVDKDNYFVISNFDEHNSFLRAYSINEQMREKAVLQNEDIFLEILNPSKINKASTNNSFSYLRNNIFCFMIHHILDAVDDFISVPSKHPYVGSIDKPGSTSCSKNLESKLVIFTLQNNSLIEMVVSECFSILITNNFLSSKTLTLRAQGSFKSSKIIYDVKASDFTPVSFMICTTQVIVFLLIGVTIAVVVAVCQRMQKIEDAKRIAANKKAEYSDPSAEEQYVSDALCTNPEALRYGVAILPSISSNISEDNNPNELSGIYYPKSADILPQVEEEEELVDLHQNTIKMDSISIEYQLGESTKQ